MRPMSAQQVNPVVDVDFGSHTQNKHRTERLVDITKLGKTALTFFMTLDEISSIADRRDERHHCPASMISS